MLPKRLRPLPSHPLGGGLTIHEARGLRARLLGLSYLPELPRGHALLIPRCRSVHTFGMRFALDLTWVGRDGETLRVDRDVPPRRVRVCRAARAVLEQQCR